MSTMQDIQAAIQKLSPEQMEDLKEWLENFSEDQLEVTDDVKAKLDKSRFQIDAGYYRVRQP